MADVHFALLPKALLNLTLSDGADVGDALRPVLAERKRSDAKESARIAAAICSATGVSTVGELRRLSDGEWRALEGVPAMCRILLKYAIRQAARAASTPSAAKRESFIAAPGGAAPSGAPESFIDILAAEFNFGTPFDMSLYNANLAALSGMGFKRDEAMEALVITENKSVDLALEVLLTDVARRKRKREETAARLGRQKAAGGGAGAGGAGAAPVAPVTPPGPSPLTIQLTEELAAVRKQLDGERKEKLKAQDEIKTHLGGVVRAAYKEYVRGMVADQSITIISLQNLKNYREQKNITQADHEGALKELGLTEESFEKMKNFASRAKGDSDCVVCLAKPKDHVIFNCMHLCLCDGCAEMMSKRGSKCPMCSKRITKILKVFV